MRSENNTESTAFKEEEAKILELSLFKTGSGRQTKVSYQDTLKAFVECQGLEGDTIDLYLCQGNEKTIICQDVLVDRYGIAETSIPLLSSDITTDLIINQEKESGEVYIAAVYNDQEVKSDTFKITSEVVTFESGNSPVKVGVVEVQEEGEEDIESMHNDRYFLPVISIKEIYQIETFKDFTPFSLKSDEKAEEVKLGFWNKIPTNDNLIYAKEPNVSIIFDIHNIGTLKEGYIFPIITDSPHIENELDNKNQHIRDFPSSFDIPFSKEQFFNIKKETNIGISATIIESEKWQPTSFTNGFKIGKDTIGFDLRIHFKERINKDFYLDIFTSEKEFGTVKLHKIKIKLKITTCFEDCSQCFDYQDVVENPQLNNQSDNVNKNRFKREKRYNNKYPQGYFHTGTDILAPLNTPIYALLCGEVIEAKDTKGDLGKIVIIKSKDKKNRDIWIQYCHLNDYIVTKGQKVRHGENIGLSGNTGNAKDIKPQYYHVHIEASTSRIFYGGNTRIDPEQFMKTKFDDTKQGNIISR